jgi:diguanylate cyclase (GGDEF)-like protein/PAS domain S-box-containing protein
MARSFLFYAVQCPMPSSALQMSAEADSIIGDISILRRKWTAALVPGRPFPSYEEVMLGSLGRLADQIMLFNCAEEGAFTIVRAGRRILDWVDAAEPGRSTAELPPDWAGAFDESLSRALHDKQPVMSLAHRVQDGIVESYQMLSLPLHSRWGKRLVAVYVKQMATRYNLVETIFRSTEQGILALAAVRDGAGHPSDFRVIAVNEGAARLLCRGAEELLWRLVPELQLGLTGRDLFDRLSDTLRTGRNGQFETTIEAAGGETHLKIEIASIGDLLSVTLTDIGAIRQREESFRLLFDGNPVPMWLYDPDTLRFVGVNDAMVRHYGYTREQFHRMTLPDIWPADEHAVHHDVVRSIGESYEPNRTWRHVKADGAEIDVLTYARRLTYTQQPAILVAVVDVTERKRAEARIEHMAHHDALTGLPNRVLFNRRLDEALERVKRQGETRQGETRRGENLAILCLDLDHFKSVNDTLGHPIGDGLLKAVAERITRCLPERGFVARLGGDEFALIQIGVDGPEAPGRLAAELIEIVSETYQIDGHDVIVGASVGIALAPGDGEASDALLRAADMALYRAKSDGRGMFHFFEPDMDRRIQARRSLELDLRKAYQHGEFELYYQPLVNLQRDAVSGFEALLRWRHPERGMIQPDAFIPLAEEIGLIVPIGEWVLRRACEDAATWPANIKVAVNLSPVQFRSRGLVQAVLSALAHSGLPASRLELEITESVLLGETEANLATLHSLRALGASISMDDFGTGYSSLSYLRSFPFDKIKIDRSFVNEMMERADCVAIIRAVAGLGMSLGIATTAEGVETSAQLDRLRAEGCTEIQGYLVSPPRPASEVWQLLSASNTRATSAA